MRNLIEKYLPARAPDGGGGGDGAAPAGDGAGAAPPPAADGSGGGEAGQTPGEGGTPPAAEPGASGPYRPEGVPETIFGENDRETIDKMAAALKGYRSKESNVPKDADGYREFNLDEASEAARPHLEALAQDPLFDKVAAIALEEKVPAATLQKLTATLYEQAAEMGILDQAINPETERAALLPQSAANLPKAQQDQAIDARLQANEDWIKLQIQHGLPKEVAEHGLLMLMDTAQGNQLIEFFKSKMTGGDRAQPLPGDGSGNSGSSEREQLRAELGRDEMQPGHPKFDRAAYDALMARYQKAIPG